MIMLSLCLLNTSSLFALPGFGVGFHWGFDNSVKMADSYNNIVTLETFDAGSMLKTLENDYPELKEITTMLVDLGLNVDSLFDEVTKDIDLSATLPFTLSRTEWQRSMVNLGGKVFLHRLKLIDALEVSFNLGVWDYKSILKYPSGIKSDALTMENVNAFMETGNYENLFEMDEIEIGLDKLGMSYLDFFNISNTPYMKLQLDVSIRKNLIAKPLDRDYFKLYLGGGPSFHFGTPILTSEFVMDVIKETIKTAGNNMKAIEDAIGGDNSELMKAVMDKLIEEGKTPKFGMHILFGTMLKFPIIPIGFYADGKLNIPFGSLDDNIELKGIGVMANIGIMLSF